MQIADIIFLLIDPPYLSPEQPEQCADQKKCFVHYLVIPEVTCRMDTSICHLGFFYSKVVDSLLDTYYYAFFMLFEFFW